MTRIRIERDGPVTTVTLARPEKRNALDLQMLDDLQQCFEAEPAPTDRAIVLRAEGSVFCAGIDMAERARLGPTTGSKSPIEPVLHAMEANPLPLVAVVQGDAIAGGNELALHCDFVVAAKTARFGMSLAQIGLAPTWALARKLMDVAGPVATREILLLGDPLPAQKFLELGIISRVAEPDGLEAAAAQIVERVARNAPLSLRAMKALLNRQTQYREHVEHADIDALVAEARASNDAREGMAARLEKRTPDFTGT